MTIKMPMPIKADNKMGRYKIPHRRAPEMIPKDISPMGGAVTLQNKSNKPIKFHLDFTTPDDLLNWASQLGIPRGGHLCILAKDELYGWPTQTPLPSYMIVNLGTTANGGTHWVAFSPLHDIWFDSFGGYPLQRVEDMYEHNGTLRYSKGQYQLLNDTACGLWAVTALAAMHYGCIHSTADEEFKKYKKRFKQGRNNDKALLEAAEYYKAANV